MITQRIDGITGIPQSYLREDPPCPKSVKIELSPRCNYLCGMCSLRTRTKQPQRDMDLDFFKRITIDMRAAGVEEIGLFYLGESFSNRELLVAACEHCKAIGIPYVFLTSNGSLAKPEIVRRLMAAGLNSLKWSVNAADDEQFQRIMGVKAALFHAALANIKSAWRLRQMGDFKTGLYASSIRFDGAQLEKMERLLDEHVRPYVDEHYWLPLYGMSLRAEEMKRKLGYVPTHGNSGRYDPATGKPTRSGLPCWALFTEGHVRYDGHVSLCCFGADDRMDVGNLHEQSWMEVWRGEPLRAVRRAQLRTAQEGAAALKGTPCEVCVAYEG